METNDDKLSKPLSKNERLFLIIDAVNRLLPEVSGQIVECCECGQDVWHKGELRRRLCGLCKLINLDSNYQLYEYETLLKEDEEDIKNDSEPISTQTYREIQTNLSLHVDIGSKQHRNIQLLHYFLKWKINGKKYKNGISKTEISHCGVISGQTTRSVKEVTCPNCLKIISKIIK